MPHRDPAFEAALRAHPADAGLRLVYADYLDDRGDEGYALAHRWLAVRGKYPLPYPAHPDAGPWSYVLGTTARAYRGEFEPGLLPPALFARVRAAATLVGQESRWGPLLRALYAGKVRSVASVIWAYFPSPQVAVEELAEVLDDPKPRPPVAPAGPQESRPA
jgi:uncharacterized protein (TIGR02996 family)